MNINKLFTEADIAELKQIMLDIQEHNGVKIREKCINLYNAGEVELYDYNNNVRPAKDLSSKAWIMAVLLSLESKGYSIVKKDTK